MHNYNSLSELLEKVSISDFVATLSSQVKAQPEDISLRTLLFKIYCVEGQWEKALMQLQSVELMDESSMQRVEFYKNMVFSELVREEVFGGTRTPGLLQDSQHDWMMKRQQATQAWVKNDREQAESLFNEAFHLAPESAGNGTHTGPFDWIADSDSRLGPACEFVSAGGYRQVPFSEITLLNVAQPKDILDLVWAPAHIVSGKETYYGYMPARYPVSHSDDQKIKLGSVTEWDQNAQAFCTGRGRKVFITNGGEFSLFEINEIVLS